MRSLPLAALVLLLATPAAATPRRATDPGAAALAAQAIPPAAVPEAALVPPEPAAPAPSAPLEEPDDLLASPQDAPDEPPIAEHIDEDSSDIEAVRQAEEASHPEQAAAAPPARGGRIELLPELDLDLPSLQGRYDIPIDVNPAVVAYVRFFQSRATRPHFVKWLARSHRYLDRFRGILAEEGLPEDTVYLAMIESGFGNFAYSRARASGPWQFISSTGRIFGLRQDFWVDERRDPEKSAHAAARYLRQLKEQTGDWRLAWAGYNAGVGRIYKARRQGYEDFWEMAAVPGRRVLRTETKGYVPKLMAAAIIAKHPEAFGFRADEIEPQAWIDYEEVEIPSATLLSVIARAAGTTERDLIDLNPELRRACTPPRPYRLKIPKERAEAFAAAWPSVQGKVKLTFAGHVVRKGDTLSAIAARHGVPVQGIVEMNGLRSARRLRIGQELMIPRPIAGVTAVAARAAPAAPSRAPVASVASAAEDRARTTHRVRRGDTLWSIAQRFGVALAELCRWNGIADPHRHTLLVGARLVVFPDRG